jgi:hypothetical protein
MINQSETMCPRCGKEKGWDDSACPECLDKERKMKDQITETEVIPETQNAPMVQDDSFASLIRTAITNKSGADVMERLEKMWQLKREIDKDEARKEYHRAMADFKANPPKIDKDRAVAFDTKTGGKTSYRHASLANVTEKISQELSKYGLSASWTTQQNGAVSVTCRITHVMGHSEETTLTAPADSSGSKNSIQAIGSTITYLERYTLLALTGLATYDQDDDGQAAEPAPEHIDEKQLSILIDLLELVGSEKTDKFLKFLGVESLDKLPKAKYQTALTALQNAQKKVTK